MNFDELVKYKEFLERANALCIHQPLFNINKETPCYFISKQFKLASRAVDDMIDLNIAYNKTLNDVYAMEAISQINVPKHL